jgi:hypothetical protein
MGKFNLMPVSGAIPEKVVGENHPLRLLLGTWWGNGFNQIWRPANKKTAPVVPPAQDRFLELNETIETLTFSEVSRNVPNRGLSAQIDISLFAVDYLQQISDANVNDNQGHPAGIHFEPGLWVAIPATANPAVGVETFARMASIPHGTTFTAQGTSFTINGPPTIDPVNIIPFAPGGAPPPQGSPDPFPESNLSIATPFRTPLTDVPHVTQAIIDNPNSLLQAGIAGKNIVSTTVLKISTVPLNPPPSGGGQSSISFLQPNALPVEIDAIFWIEKIKHESGIHTFQLQYSQRVMLNFNNRIWPHISVATLTQP